MDFIRRQIGAVRHVSEKLACDDGTRLIVWFSHWDVANARVVDTEPVLEVSLALNNPDDGVKRWNFFAPTGFERARWL